MTQPNRYLENIAILVIEPNQFMRSVVKRVLQSFGCADVHEAEDGEDALDILQTSWPDIILTEWVMQPQNGVEFTRTIRSGKDITDPCVPIIMVTAYSELARVIAARDSGVNEYVRKPFSALDLMTRITEVIEQPRPFIKAPGYTGPDRRRRRKGEFDGDDRRGDVAMIDADALSQDQINELIAPTNGKSD